MDPTPNLNFLADVVARIRPDRLEPLLGRRGDPVDDLEALVAELGERAALDHLAALGHRAAASSPDHAATARTAALIGFRFAADLLALRSHRGVIYGDDLTDLVDGTSWSAIMPHELRNLASEIAATLASHADPTTAHSSASGREAAHEAFSAGVGGAIYALALRCGSVTCSTRQQDVPSRGTARGGSSRLARRRNDTWKRRTA